MDRLEKWVHEDDEDFPSHDLYDNDVAIRRSSLESLDIHLTEDHHHVRNSLGTRRRHVIVHHEGDEEEDDDVNWYSSRNGDDWNIFIDDSDANGLERSLGSDWIESEDGTSLQDFQHSLTRIQTSRSDDDSITISFRNESPTEFLSPVSVEPFSSPFRSKRPLLSSSTLTSARWTPKKVIRFASIIATDMAETPPPKSNPPVSHPIDLLDMMESSSSGKDTASMDTFDIFEQETDTEPISEFSTKESSSDSDEVLQSCDPVGDDTLSHSTSEKPYKEEERSRRRLSFMIAGLVAVPLIGWAVRRLLNRFQDGNDEDSVGAELWIHKGTSGGGGGDPSIHISDVTQALQHNSPDAAAALLIDSGSLSQGGLSQSTSQSGMGAGTYVPGGAEQAALNPALQS